MKIGIMITTHNRIDDLKVCLNKISTLNPAPHEIMITADGCTDSTMDWLKERSGTYRVFENSPGIGSVASRAAMMEAASSDLVLSLDDDSYPEQPDCLNRLTALFERSPRLAVATFPQRTDEYPESLHQIDFGKERRVRSFPNSGACFKLSVYRTLPGFEKIFSHMYEEPDYAMQCVANGWDVLYWPEIKIRHHYTPQQRNELKNHHRHARNELWSTLMRCPFPQVILLIPIRVMSQARFAFKQGPKWFFREPVWWIEAISGLSAVMNRRNPVTWKGYRKWLSLPDVFFGHTS